MKAEIYASFVSLYLYVPDEGTLLPTYRDCATSNDLELYLMCCGVMLLLLIIYIYIYIYIHSSYDETIQRKQSAQYRKRRAITVKVTLTSARCDTVFHIRR